MNCALKVLSTGQHRTTCNSVSCATLHTGQIRSLSVTKNKQKLKPIVSLMMYKYVWNTQLKPCHYKFQMLVSIHLQIRYHLMNGAKCPINIKSIASLNIGMPLLPSTNWINLSRKTCKNWFISSTPSFSHTKPNPYWYNLQRTFEAQFLLPRSSCASLCVCVCVCVHSCCTRWILTICICKERISLCGLGPLSIHYYY